MRPALPLVSTHCKFCLHILKMETATKINIDIAETKATGDVTSVPESDGNLAPFTSHSVNLEVGSNHFTLRVLKMNGSSMLFLSDRNAELFSELAVAMPPRNPGQTQAISSTIIGGHGQTDSSVLAAKLSKRFGRQFYVSVNMRMDRLIGPLFEKALVTYINDHVEMFA